jgi:hypothetical protein
MAPSVDANYSPDRQIRSQQAIVSKVPKNIYLMQEFEFHIRPPGENDDVIISGKPLELKIEDLRSGLSRFGGPSRAPNYMMAYLLAAKILVEHGSANNTLDDIGLPAFYLQRHTIELMIKRLLIWLHDLAEHSARESDCKFLSQEQKSRLKKCHNLSKLCTDTGKLSEQMGYGPLPNEIQEFVRLIEKFESNPTWSRYPDSNRDTVRHMENEVAVPIVDLQKRLEQIIDSVLHRFGGKETYESHLYYAWENSMKQ